MAHNADGGSDAVRKQPNQFRRLAALKPPCDICGSPTFPMYGGGWDNDRLVCSGRACGAEITFPTSTTQEKVGLTNG